MALFRSQGSTAYRLNYLWYTKQEIASAINEVGKNKGISVNPRQDFAKFAEKILKLQTSVWSSANDSEDPHLTITENGYYKVSDLSLEQFGDASKKTVVSSFYVNVQSAPIIIGNTKMECGTVASRRTKSPDYDFDESFTGSSLAEILTQFVSRLGIVMGAQAVKNGNTWTVTFDNGKVITISESGSIHSASGIFLATIAYGGPTFPITFRLIKNTKAIFFTTIDTRPTISQAKSFILATTDRGEDAAWVHLGNGENGNGTRGENIYIVLNGSVIDYGEVRQIAPLPFPSYMDTYSSDGQVIYSNSYMMYNVTMMEVIVTSSSFYGIAIDFGENLFIGPVIYANSEIEPPVSFTLNNSEFSVLLKNSCFWQRL